MNDTVVFLHPNRRYALPQRGDLDSADLAYGRVDRFNRTKFLGAILMQHPSAGKKSRSKAASVLVGCEDGLLSESSRRNELLSLVQATKTGGRTWLAQLNISTLS